MKRTGSIRANLKKLHVSGQVAKDKLAILTEQRNGQRDEGKDRGHSIKGFNGGKEEKERSVVPKTPRKAKWGLKSLSMSCSNGARDPVKVYSS